MNKPSLTVLFITLNEEFHIGAAIDNVKDIAEKIYVVDSGSLDKTVEIAKAKGAEVVYHKFENFSKQWNFALSLPIDTDWTMKMDPDERLTETVKNNIMSALQTNDVRVGFSLRLVLWFMGKPLRGVTLTVPRIWRSGHCRFSEILVNEHPMIDGNWIAVDGCVNHLDSSNLTCWLAKQNHYTLKEAIQRVNGEQLPATPRLFGTKLERRMFLKWLYRRLPFRYFIEDVYLFLWRGAWKSGVHGWRWVKCREIVSRMAEYKYLELKGKENK